MRANRAPYERYITQYPVALGSLSVTKTALITGGAKRIGARIARELHADGYNLILHYRDSQDAALALCDSLNARRSESTTVLEADLLQTDRYSDLVHQIMSMWGRLDVLVNNASSFYPTPVDTVTETQWDELIGSNMKAPFFLSVNLAPLLRKQQGCIVNMTDIHGIRPLKGYTAYSIAKAGLIAITKSLAHEFGPTIRVNGIAPGAILWPEAQHTQTAKEEIVSRIPLAKPGDPSDIARAVLFLIRDADYITGQILTVDGGRTLLS